MPLYDFACARCAHEFEDLVRRDEVPECPKCGATQVERKLPVFAVGGSRSPEAPPPGGCGRCGDPRGPGACQL